MKVIVLDPWKVLLAGVLSALLIALSVLGVLALAGVFSSDAAEAYGAAGVGAKRWYFAEGYTGPGFEEWILIYNPPTGVAGGSGNVSNPVVNLYGPGGFIGNITGLALAPGQRISININEYAKSLYSYTGDISIVVYDQYPFLCERAMYFDYKGEITGGSQSWGYQESSTE